MDMRGAPRILVVDDEVSVRVTLDAVLRRQGYAVTTAADGREALACMAQDPFDLFLIDLKLPGVGGVEVAQAARSRQPAAAILILTGSTDLAGTQVEAEMSAFPYMLKTASPQEVLDQVAALLQQITNRDVS